MNEDTVFWGEDKYATIHNYIVGCDTVKPPKKGQHGDGPFVPSREVVLFRRFSLLHINIAKCEALLQF